MVKCGKCGQYHENAAGVRACYGQGGAVAVQKEQVRTTYVPAKASEKQVAFLKALCAERPNWSKEVGYDDLVIEGMSKLVASQAITDALAVPAENMASVRRLAIRQNTVPEGRYALRDEEGVVKFYQVQRPKEGRWAGCTFVKTQASDMTYPVRGKTMEKVLKDIEAFGIEASLRLYGTELGECGVCGRTLTDEKSRAYGIGPVCRERF